MGASSFRGWFEALFFRLAGFEFFQDFVQIICFPAIFDTQRDIHTLAAVTGMAVPLGLFPQDYDISGPFRFLNDLEARRGWNEFTRVMKRTSQLAGSASAAGRHIEFHIRPPLDDSQDITTEDPEKI
jgi:hypothetical protein